MAASNQDSLGDRMKGYERAFQYTLPRRMPVIIRVDGRAFHTLTRGARKPFDEDLMQSMDCMAIDLCAEIQGAQLAYIQSDEVSVLIHGYKELQSQPWVNNELSKMLSLSASIATDRFNWSRHAQFDSRAFVLPEDDVCNYFLWRQQDATRNSINMLARAHFSHQRLHGMSCSSMQDLLHETKGVNWNDLPTRQKRGRCVMKMTYEPDGSTRHHWNIDDDIPIFSQDRNYIEKHVNIHKVSDV